MARPVGTPRTQRNRKLECEHGCGFAVYASRKMIARGLPGCPCGGRLWPADLEDAAAVLSAADLERHPGHAEYKRALADVMHGQAPHWKSLRGTGRELRSPDVLVQVKLDRARRERAMSNRLGALREYAQRNAEPIPF